MNMYFEFQTPPRLLSGAFALENIAQELKLLGAGRPLLVSDAGLLKIGATGLCERALSEQGMPPLEIWTDVPPDSSVALVGRIAARYRELSCDSVVAVGG